MATSYTLGPKELEEQKYRRTCSGSHGGHEMSAIQTLYTGANRNVLSKKEFRENLTVTRFELARETHHGLDQA